ncbi:MAG: Ig-like domain-containing protein, partial [Pyrinomonadaceae bacterium]
MKTAPSPSAGKLVGPAQRVGARRLAFVACTVLLGVVIAGAAFVAAQSPAVPVVATVRHAPVLNGRVEGSVQMLAGEYLNLNTGNVVKGDLLVPGTPNVVKNGLPIYQGTKDGSGSASPSNYQVTLNTGSEVRHVVRRTDPFTLAPVPVPPAPVGTRYVSINLPGQSVGTWATVRNLTLNSGVGSYTVPAGTYGAFTANAGASFVLGVAGATQASVYNFEDITLNSLANLHVVGPVVVNVANRVSANSLCVMGSAQNPGWLVLNVSRYDVTINGSELNGLVRAPAGTVNISAGRLRGSVAADRLNLNAGVIIGVTTDTTAPIVAITQPAEGLLTRAASVTVSGTFSDDSTTTVKVNGVAATISGNNYSASVPLTEGANTLRAVATDSAGNSSEATRAVTRDSTPPAVSIQQPAAGSYTNAGSVTVNGTYSDQSAAVITVNGVAATLQGGGYSASVPLDEGANTISVVASDAAGNQSQASREIVRDTAAPAVTIGQPLDGQVTGAASVNVTGTFSDATTTAVTVNGVAATLSGNGYTAAVALAEGANSILVVATDAAGNSSEAALGVTRDSVGPSINLSLPTNNFVTNSTSVTVYGTVTDATLVGISITNGGVSIDGETFSGQAVLPEGVSQLRVVATDAAGNQTEVTRTVTADETDPVLSELSPAEGTVVAARNVTVQGRVSDSTTVAINVGGVSAGVGADGLFSAADVPLAEGENTLLVTATDATGNKTVAELNLRGKDLTPPAAPQLFAAPTRTRLSELPVEGKAEPGVTVHITGGAEPISANAAAGTGLFLAPVKLAAGANALTVTATDAEGNVSPPATVQVVSDPQAALPPTGQPAYISVSIGDTQRGLAGAEFPRPLVAVVTDRLGTPVSGVPVSFNVVQGGGHFVDGPAVVQVQTDSDGYARARYVAGA